MDQVNGGAGFLGKVVAVGLVGSMLKPEVGKSVVVLCDGLFPGVPRPFRV
jgi:hypothetical protein